MRSVTTDNVRYLKSEGCHIVKTDYENGWVVARNNKSSKSLDNLSIIFPSDQRFFYSADNQWIAVQNSDQGGGISTVTSYWRGEK